MRRTCNHNNKAYGPILNGHRQWVCRDCGQEGEYKDDSQSKDYYNVLCYHIEKGTLKSKELLKGE